MAKLIVVSCEETTDKLSGGGIKEIYAGNRENKILLNFVGPYSSYLKQM